MAGRLEDSKAFRGVIERDNLNIDALELHASTEAAIKKYACIYADRGYPVKMLLCSARLHRYPDGSWGYPHIEMFAGGNLVYTVPSKAFGQCMLFYKDREVRPRWNDEVPAELLAKLNQVKYFQQSYDENGYDVDNFNEIPSLLENEVEFVGATREMLEYVGSFM